MIEKLKLCAIIPRELKVLAVLLVLFAFGAQSAIAQQVKGKVKDAEDNSDLPGVTILVVGTSTGTVTDIDGNYSIKIPDGATQLQFQFIGYGTQVIDVGNQSTIDVALQIETEMLEEIVKIGYGEQTKKEVTGAVASVETEEILKTATPDIGTALQGQIAGVNVQASSGAPGATANILIRGVTSITGGNTPLWVVDGVPQEDGFVPALSPNEIESINILKDAASTAIYGTRAAAGVILVTTKQGEEGDLKVNLDASYGVQRIISTVELLDAAEQIYVEKQQQYMLDPNNHWEGGFNQIENNYNGFTNDTDLLEDTYYQDLAAQQNYSVNLSGGSKKVTFNMNSSYFSQDGTLINSNYERYTGRSNFRYKDKKWTVVGILSARLEDRRFASPTMIQQGLKYRPISNPVDPNAFEIQADSDQNSLFANLGGIVQRLQEQNLSRKHQFSGNGNVNYNIGSGFSFDSRISVSFEDDLRKVINPRFAIFDNSGNSKPTNSRSRVRNEHRRRTRTSFENSIRYNKTFNKNHKVNALVNYSVEKFTSEGFRGERFDLGNNNITVLNGAFSDPNASSINGFVATLLGVLGRAQYSYKNKYLFSATLRHDYSSKFHPDNNSAFFPGVSAGWNVSDEEFWDPISTVINTFKIRAGWGTVGNQAIANYQYDPTVTTDRNAIFGRTDVIQTVNGSTQNEFRDPSIHWETTVEKNVGFDMYMLNNQISLTADAYVKDKKDMLFPVLIPVSGGVGVNQTYVSNVGNMINRGLEIAANYRHNGEFSWSIGANVTFAENEVTSLGSDADLQFISGSRIAGGNDQDLISVLKVGEQAGSFYMYETRGIVKTEEELAEYQKVQSDARIGDLIRVDRNDDGVINDEDRYIAGSWMPDLEGGVQVSMSWKGIDFSMSWVGSYGADLINGYRAIAMDEGRGKDLLYMWTHQNQDATIPTWYGGGTNSYRGLNDIWLEDGSYVRLRNATLGYTIPKRITESIRIKKIRVYVNATNALTFTNYSGFDPEVAGYDENVGGSSLGSRGIDKATYPISAVYSGGIQIQF
ncbi:SusC/RagA family TonB-linked outer membrane protein [Reichenbachiella versicolor]|uniref:SusC/RagA family TonB-linked outer membrane protein n=1 Tax=Reichenbachiella versicolor TaxID=1821036 RepID=UPI0013A58DD4|nr:TonB-dependent receptor [Reichenbachiella versicolor]